MKLLTKVELVGLRVSPAEALLDGSYCGHGGKFAYVVACDWRIVFWTPFRFGTYYFPFHAQRKRMTVTHILGNLVVYNG